MSPFVLYNALLLLFLYINGIKPINSVIYGTFSITFLCDISPKKWGRNVKRIVYTKLITVKEFLDILVKRNAIHQIKAYNAPGN